MSWLVDQNQKREDYKNEETYSRKVTVKSVLCNRPSKGGIFLAIFAATVPVLVYYLVIDKGTYKTIDTYTCLVDRSFRVPCGKVNLTAGECAKIKCCYDKNSELCYHYVPSRYSYDLNKDTNEYNVAQHNTTFGTKSTEKLIISVNEVSENKVTIVLHEQGINVEENILDNTNYIIKLAKEKLMVEIYRTSNGDQLLSTAKGPLIFSENYWEWTLHLTNEYLFGLGQTLIKLDENTTFTKVIYKNKVDHYVYPVLWAYRNKQFHGIVIKHDGPIEITILPSHLILLKGLVAKKIEIDLFIGPNPSLLHDQMLNSQDIPPNWTLQPHMCRKGSELNLTKLVAAFTPEQNQYSNCIHENLFLAMIKDGGNNIEVVQPLVTALKDQGNKFLFYLPPQVPFEHNPLYSKAESLNMLYIYNESVYKGKYLTEDVVYLDYSYSDSDSYLEEFHKLLEKYIDFNDIDGFVLNDNWPADESYEMNTTYFPYLPEAFQQNMSYTLPWNAKINDTLHIEKHNAYGSDHIQAIHKFYNSKKADLFILSASKHFGQSQPSVIENIKSSWDSLRAHISNVLFNSIIGNHLVSVPVCGDTSAYDKALHETLCIRWYLVAATMPMLEVSSADPLRNPVNLNTKFAENSAEWSIQRRNMLLPYYYTLLSKNEPVVRPMFYDFYDLNTTFEMERQYMIGENILVAHPLSSGRTKLQVYLPSRVKIWYELWGGKMYNSTVEPWIDIDVTETDFISFVAQGHVIPLKVDNSFNLIIALNCQTHPCTANGTLLQGSYLTFNSDLVALTISNITQENCNYTIASVKLYRYEGTLENVTSYSLNKSVCNGEDTVIINYEQENSISTTTTGSNNV